MPVIIKSDGFFFHDVHSHCKEIDREGEINGRNFPRWLREECIIKKDVTLREIMTHVARNKNLSSFIGRYSMCPMREFNKLLSKKVKKNKYIKKLAVYWTGEWWDEENEIEDLSLFWSFHGIGDVPEEERDNLEYDEEFDSKENWSVSGDVSDVLDLPVEIDNNAILYHHTKEYQSEITLKREICPTFLDFLNAIYFDISFYGTPEQAKKQFADIEDTRKKINSVIESKENNLEDEDEIEEFINMEHLMEILDKKEKVREAIYCLISDGMILENSFEENWDLIEESLDFDPEYSEEDFQRFKEFWLFRYLDLVKEAIKEGKISDLDQITPENL